MTTHFKNNTFFPEYEGITHIKEFITLPDRTRILVNNQNMYKFLRVVPLSSIASTLMDKRYSFGLNANNPLAFYDIETNREANTFIMGNINGTIYYDVNQFMQSLWNNNIRIGYNCYRFDLPILYKNLNNPSKYMGTYNLNKFTLYYIKKGLDLDLIFFMRFFGFKDFRLNSIAREIGLKVDEITEFDKEKCNQDTELLYQIFFKLDIPQVAEFITTFANVDLHILQNVFYDRFLKYIIISAYLDNGYIPTSYPNITQRYLTLDKRLVKSAKAGTYKRAYHFDIKNAYPTTAINNNLSIYPNERIFPQLLEKIIRYPDNDNPNLYSVKKKLANSLIGYMNDRTNYFSNPLIWYNTVTDFNNIMKGITEQHKTVLANIDGFITTETINTKNIEERTVNGIYKLRLKDIFKFLKVYHVNKYLGVTANNKVKMKGFNINRVSAIQIYNEWIKEDLPNTLSINKTFKNLKHGEPDLIKKSELWKMSFRKTSNICTKIGLLKYWEDARQGFNDIIIEPENRPQMLKDFRGQF